MSPSGKSETGTRGHRFGGRGRETGGAGEPGGPGRRPADARERLYGGVLRAARALAPAAGALLPSLAGGVSDRRAAATALEKWALTHHPSGEPLLWLHGASAGELLGAAPAVEALRRRLALRLMVTHFSPSGASAAASFEPEWYGYPPFDAPSDCWRAVRAASPAALVFATGDLWPGLCRAAAEARIPMGMVNATVRADSSRLRAPARWLLVPSYRRLNRVGAVSLEDADRLLRLGVRSAALTITGDGAFDRALSRADRAREALERAQGPGPSGPPGGSGATPESEAPPVLVAGSTWPDDEEALLRAAAKLAPRGLAPRLVLVPHQPHARAVAALRRRCRATLRREPVLWSRAAAALPEAAPAVRLRALLNHASAAGRPVVVDAVGFLADLYPAGDVAWVGGGFGRAGLHSVVEPAAAEIPVLFGPRHERREARELLECGAARSADARDVPATLAEMVRDAPARRAAGRRAREYVETGAGAATATAALLAELVEGGSMSDPEGTAGTPR